MKKIFTLICMAFVAMSVNAQEVGIYPLKSVIWKSITWKNGNNKEDKDKNPMYFLMGTGNGYATLAAEYYYSEDKGEYGTRPYYTYIDYEAGEAGLPAYGLYYKFTPSTSGTIKMCTWINKGGDNRKVFVVKGSDGKSLTPFVDYTFEGYINGQNAATDQPKIDPETGVQEIDNEGNPVFIVAPIFFSADEFKAKLDEQYAGANPYKLSFSNQAVWGWLSINVEAGESYTVYQQSSQLGFGGFEFGGQSYVASPDGGLAPEFAAVVDSEGNATNISDRGSVVTFTAAGVAVEAVGGAEPESVEADFGGGGSGEGGGEGGEGGEGGGEGDGISTVTANQTNAIHYNMTGQQVSKGYKGIVIENGKKVLVK